MTVRDADKIMFQNIPVPANEGLELSLRSALYIVVLT